MIHCDNKRLLDLLIERVVVKGVTVNSADIFKAPFKRPSISRYAAVKETFLTPVLELIKQFVTYIACQQNDAGSSFPVW